MHLDFSCHLSLKTFLAKFQISGDSKIDFFCILVKKKEKQRDKSIDL